MSSTGLLEEARVQALALRHELVAHDEWEAAALEVAELLLAEVRVLKACQITPGGVAVSEQIHPTAERVLVAIARAWGKRGIAPTARELGELVGMRSTSAVHYWLRELAEGGLIHCEAGSARTVRLTPRGIEHIQITQGVLS